MELNIAVTPEGVREVRSRVNSVGEARGASELAARCTLGFDLVPRLAAGRAPTQSKPAVRIERRDDGTVLAHVEVLLDVESMASGWTWHNAI